MAQKACKKCGSELAPKASHCSSCGAKQKGGAARIVLIVLGSLVGLFVVLLVVAGIFGDSQDMCEQAGDAAYYVATHSTSPDDVPRVISKVVDEDKYPILGNKMIGAIGLVVITGMAANKTPEEMSSGVKAQCRASTKQ